MSVMRGSLPDEFFDESEAWPRERWRGMQWRRLRRVLRLAHRELPFYRRRFDDAGLDPDEIRSFDDFSHLPRLYKADILSALKAAGAHTIGMETPEPFGPTALGMTSGTLGTAILSFPERWRRAHGDALCRAYWWAGMRRGTRIMAVAPAWHSMALQESRVIERLGAIALLPWGTFLPRFADSFLATLVDLRPSFASFFLPMLYALLAECRRRGMPPEVAFASVDSVLVVGAPMTPRARQTLKQELGVRDVFDGAGSAEGLLAMECSEHDGQHYFVDVCYVEIVDPTSGRVLAPGQRGSIVVSSLIPHGSLHLRYNSDDIGEILPHGCRCGRSWPLLKIYDRRANLFRVRDRDLLWYDVRQCLDEVPELIGVPCAVIRCPSGAPVLHLAIERPPQTGSADVSARLRQLASERLGVPLQVEWVDELPVRWKGVTVIDEEEWEGRNG